MQHLTTEPEVDEKWNQINKNGNKMYAAMDFEYVVHSIIFCESSDVNG